MDHSTTTTKDATLTTDEPTPPSRAVVDTVADAEGVDPVELSPLYEAVDPDALDALFRSGFSRPAAPTTRGEVRFTYEGHEIRVTAAGRVSLEDA